MAFTIVLTKTENKESVFIPTTGDWEDQKDLWTVGNYGCDCNRDVYFHSVNDPDYDSDIDCSVGKYLLTVIGKNQKIIYNEIPNLVVELLKEQEHESATALNEKQIIMDAIKRLNEQILVLSQTPTSSITAGYLKIKQKELQYYLNLRDKEQE